MDLAEETAAEMSELLDELREAMPETQLVLMAPLPKGEYWPNRCTPAFRAFSETLQVLFRPKQCMTYPPQCLKIAQRAGLLWLLPLMKAGSYSRVKIFTSFPAFNCQEARLYPKIMN